MSRLMSVSLTETAVVQRAKTVTRRSGWLMLQSGDRLTLCRKVMGRKAGEPLVRLAEVQVVSVCRERLAAITPGDVVAEGFPEWTPEQFVTFFIANHKGTYPTSIITRIEWRYIDMGTTDQLALPGMDGCDSGWCHT